MRLRHTWQNGLWFWHEWTYPVRPSLRTTPPSGRHLPRQSSLKTSVRPPGAFPPVAPVPISTPDRTPPAVDLTVSVRSFYFSSKVCHHGICKRPRDLHIHVRSDNRATVAQINKMWGARSVDLFRETKELWSFALKRGITVTADHLPGDQNLVADRESRIFLDSSAWKLAAWVFKELEARWGPFEVDMFADRLNRQKEIFYSWKPDPLAAATDAFMMPWGTLQGYMFPPFCLIGRCLAKIKKEEAKVVVVAPTWQAQPWFPQPWFPLQIVPKGVATSTAGDKQPHVSGVESVWQRGRQQGLSEGAATLVTKAWRTGTKCAYNTPWNKWVGWCGKRKIDPLQATVGQIANFLADRFEEGLEYATMNVYRSALSAFHPLVEGCKVGQHPTIVRFMQGSSTRGRRNPDTQIPGK